MENSLNKSISTLKGVGEKLEEAFLRLGINRIKDLLLYRPYGAELKQQATSFKAIDPAVTYIVSAKIIKIPEYTKLPKGRKHKIVIECEAMGMPIFVTFFNFVPYHILTKIKIGEAYTFVGRITYFLNKMQMTHPDFYQANELQNIRKIEPKYPLTYGLNAKIINNLVDRAIFYVDADEEWLPARVIRKFGFQSFYRSLRIIHYLDAATSDEYNTSLQRLAFDEMLAQNLMLKISRNREEVHNKTPVNINKTRLKEFVANLKFKLTDSQNRVLREVLEDIAKPKSMLRLVQGDVGSGKTIIAVISMLAAISEGGQAVIMAPTDILAQQHFAGISEMLEPLGIRVGLLKNAMPAKLKAENLTKIESGEISIIVGTHSLIQDSVSFADLKLAVIDEQHRFGVKQRLALSQKGNNPDVLLMTATPIPRTLMLANYGDIDVSLNDSKPEGRKPIDTKCVGFNKLEDLKKSLQKFINNGEKIYWICTLVEESEALNLTSVEERFQDLKKTYGSQVAMLHGHMNNAEKNRIMEEFAFTNNVNILVATTVVEVGVNVPTATCIVIENAERFGLAQLHQLRGRVGRSHLESFCILLYGKETSKIARERLDAMRESQDGFYLAEKDLELRGGGEILGTRQSGGIVFKFAEFPRDAELLKLASEESDIIISENNQEKINKIRSLLELYDYEDLFVLMNA